MNLFERFLVMKYKDLKFKTHFFMSTNKRYVFLVARIDNIVSENDGEYEYIWIDIINNHIGLAGKATEDELITFKPCLYVQDFLSVMSNTEVTVGLTRNHDIKDFKNYSGLVEEANQYVNSWVF